MSNTPLQAVAPGSTTATFTPTTLSCTPIDCRLRNNHLDPLVRLDKSDTSNQRERFPEEESIAFANRFLPLLGPYTSIWTVRDAARTLLSADDVQKQAELESQWNCWSMHERAVFLSLFRGYEDIAVAPHHAFFLYQLFGRNAPLETAIYQSSPQQDGGHIQYRFRVGTRECIDHANDINGYPVGHTHPADPNDDVLNDAHRSIFPHWEDHFVTFQNLHVIKHAGKPHDQHLGTPFLIGGALLNAVLSPYGGSFFTTVPEETNDERNFKRVTQIQWATRPHFNVDQDVARRLEQRALQTYRSYGWHRNDDEHQLSHIPWEKLLTDLALLFAAR